MPVSPQPSLLRYLYVRIFMFVYKRGYLAAIRMGLWWEPLSQEASPGPGERILEVSAEGCSACETLARLYPAVHFFIVAACETERERARKPKQPRATAWGSVFDRLPRCIIRQSDLLAGPPSFVAGQEARPSQRNEVSTAPWRCVVSC